MRPHPPRWAERWVERWSTGSAAGPSVAGDLWEEWERIRTSKGASVADRWYARTAIAISLRYAAGRVVDTLREAPSALGGDLRHVARGLRRAPGFVAVSVLSLGGGLGLTTAVFALINGILFAPLPWPGGERLVDLDLIHPREVCAGCSVGASYPAFEAWRVGIEGLEAVGALDGRSVLISGEGAPFRTQATSVSREVPDLLGLQPSLGRLFTPDEHLGVGPPVTVLSHGLWTRRYGADPDVLERSISVDGIPHRIVGVLGPGARSLDRGEMWFPLEPSRSAAGLDELGLWVFGRVAPGADVARIAATMTALHQGLAADVPSVDDEWTARVVPMRSALVGEVGEPAIGYLFLAAAASVLLIACLNLAALLYARVTERTRELRVRAALGSGSMRLARLILLEAGTVALMGMVLGLVVTYVAKSALVSWFGAALPPWAEFPMDVRVVWVGAAGALVAVLFCGLAPALRAARGGTGGVLPSASVGRAPGVLRRQRALLAAQVALGVALVASTALSVRTFYRVSDFDDLGYRADGILGVRVIAEGPSVPDAERRAHLAESVQESFRAQPGVDAVTAEAQMFIGGWGAVDEGSPMHIEGRTEPVSDRIVPRHAMAVAPGYFDLFRIGIERGRPLDARDAYGAPGAAVVNNEAARLLWPGEDPLGARFRIDNGTVDGVVTVVGVASDIVMNPLSESRRPQARIYFSLPQTNATAIVFRASYQGEPPTPREWEERLGATAPGLPIEGVTTVRQELRRWIAPVIATAGIMGTLGTLALVLLALGVFGTLSYQVAARSRDIGIRRALGAGGRRLAHETARDVSTVVLAGIAAGCLLAGIAGRTLRSSFIQIGTGDPWLLAGAGSVVLLAAALAAYGPLRRALRVDPLEALKAD